MNKTLFFALVLTLLGPSIFIYLITVPLYIGAVGDGVIFGGYLALATIILPIFASLFCVYLFIRKTVSRVFSSITFLLNFISIFLIIAITVSLNS